MAVVGSPTQVHDDDAGHPPGALAPPRSEFHLSQAQQLAQVGRWEWDASTGPVSMTPEMRRVVRPSGEMRVAHLRHFVTYDAAARSRPPMWRAHRRWAQQS